MSLFSPYVIIGIVLAIVSSYVFGRAQQYHRDEVRWTKQVELMQQAGLEEKARIEMARQKEREASEAKLQKVADERRRQLVQAQKRIAELDADVAAVRAAGIGRLLNDTIDEASGTAGPASVAPKGAAPAPENPDTSIGHWAQWSVEVINLYAAARDQILGWQEFYAAVRKAN